MHYTIKTRTDKQVGDVFPQINCLSLEQAHQISAKRFPEFEVQLQFELAPKAKLTDVLSQAAINANGFIVNENVKNILEKHKLMNHQFYPAVIKTQKGDLNYYWLHLVDETFLNKINYPESKFFRTEYGFREEDLLLSSFHDYEVNKQKFGNMGTIESDYLVLDKKLQATTSIISFSIFDYNIYVNKEIYTDLIQHNITGVEFEKATSIGFK